MTCGRTGTVTCTACPEYQWVRSGGSSSSGASSVGSSGLAIPLPRGCWRAIVYIAGFFLAVPALAYLGFYNHAEHDAANADDLLDEHFWQYFGEGALTLGAGVAIVWGVVRASRAACYLARGWVGPNRQRLATGLALIAAGVVAGALVRSWGTT
jgi:hypothetical protein